MKKYISSLLFCSYLLFSCSSDSTNETNTSVIGNWLIHELTYNGYHTNWGECGHLENMTFYQDHTFAWEAYAIANEFGDCIPIAPAQGVWEQINHNTIEITDNDIVFQVTYNETFLYLNSTIEPNQDQPNGVSIRFTFTRN
ncbi:MAG: hypothetical protein ACPG6B_07925 [Oceanihabitans sp.]